VNKPGQLVASSANMRKVIRGAAAEHGQAVKQAENREARLLGCIEAAMARGGDLC
jgi:hypothetical protein